MKSVIQAMKSTMQASAEDLQAMKLVMQAMKSVMQARAEDFQAMKLNLQAMKLVVQAMKSATLASITCHQAWLCKPDASDVIDTRRTTDVPHAGKGSPPFPGTPSGSRPIPRVGGSSHQAANSA